MIVSYEIVKFIPELLLITSITRYNHVKCYNLSTLYFECQFVYMCAHTEYK